MRYHMSQDELRRAVQYYLNECVLKNPVTVEAVDPKDTAKKAGVSYVLHVIVTDDQANKAVIDLEDKPEAEPEPDPPVPTEQQFMTKASSHL